VCVCHRDLGDMEPGLDTEHCSIEVGGVGW
jgi:hypothetical protein